MPFAPSGRATVGRHHARLRARVCATTAEGDREAAQRWDAFRNRWFLDPILRGAYPAELLDRLQDRLGPLGSSSPDDLEVIAQPIDFLGVNYYSRASSRTIRTMARWAYVTPRRRSRPRRWGGRSFRMRSTSC